MKKSRIVISTFGLIAVSIVIAYGGTCMAPTATAGNCGLANQQASTADGCVQTTGTGQVPLLACAGDTSNSQCLYQTIPWSVSYTYYTPTSVNGVSGCSTPTLPNDSQHPAGASGTCQQAYVGPACGVSS